MDHKDVIIQDLRAENKKLTEELEKYKQLEKKMYEKFEGHINTETIVNSFIDFYDMQEVNEELADCLLLTNESVKKYKEYKRLEEQGLLLKLPCRIGDTVYDIFMGEVKEKKVVAVVYFHSPSVKQITIHASNGRGATTPIELYRFGKTIFLTEQEAQTALEKMKGGDE